MGSSVDKRSAVWLEVVSQLLQRPLTRFPVEDVIVALEASYDVTGCTWNWFDAPAGFGQTMSAGAAEAFSEDSMSEWGKGDLWARHGLIRWYRHTGDPAAQTLDRVPGAISPRRDLRIIRLFMAPGGCEEQLSIPYRLDAQSFRIFTVARAGRDFSDDDLTVARRIQPALRGLDTQVQILSALAPTVSPAQGAGAAELTGRELAVLRLLAGGLTAAAIARRLESSPRTVHKHLQHTYRKLDVNDRLDAVRVAASLRLIVPPDHPDRFVQQG